MRKVKDQILYDDEKKSMKVSYPWKLGDNLRQAVKVQGSIERRLIRDKAYLEAFNSELKKFIDIGAISRITQQEMDENSGSICYVTHLPVHKPESATTPLGIVTNTSFINETAKLSPNNCM